MTSVDALAGAPARRPGRGGVVLATALGALGAALLTLLSLAGREGLERPGLFASDGWTDAGVTAVLTDRGIPVSWFVSYVSLLEALLIGTGLVAAYLIARGEFSWFRAYLALAIVLHTGFGGVLMPIVGAVRPGLEPAASLLQGLAWFVLFPLAYVFPDGRFVPRWTRWLLPAWAALFVALLVLVTEPPDQAWVAAPMLLLLASCAGAQVHRYLHRADPVQRQQIRWVVLAVGLRFLYMVVILVTPVGGLMRETTPRGLAADLVTTTVSYGISALLPVSVAIAVLRYRLFDVDVVIRWALVYGLLTAFVLGAYAVVVGGVGALAGGTRGGALPLVATVIVALAVEPLRRWLQHRVNGLVYGQRDDPYAVISRLGEQLGSAVPSPAVLQTTVDTIGTALKLPYVSIEPTAGGLEPVSYGRPPAAGDRTENFPLSFEGEPLGRLVAAGRAGERLGGADRRLLAEVSRQAGVSVSAAALTTELRRARERAVAVREEERRRLHRDLHDGLGPTLASLYQRTDAALALMRRDPAAAERLIAVVSGQLKATIGEIRELVYSLRPPALDELGLLAAVEEACLRLNGDPDRLRITVLGGAGPMPQLPAAIEVAAYRIAVESVTNVVRHAGATRCEIRLHRTAGELLLDVTDDGVGLAPGVRPGAGLRSMRERAEETGGTLERRPGTPRGTIVSARLPLPPEGAAHD